MTRTGLTSGGAVLVAVGGLLILATVRTPEVVPLPVRMAALVLVSVGAVAFGVGLAGVLAQAARQSRDPLYALGSHRMVLASAALVIVLSNVLATVLLVVLPVGRELNVWRFLIGGLAPSVVILLFFGLVLRSTGVLDPAALGLRRPRLQRDLWLGLAGGMLLILAALPIQLALRELGVEQTQAALFTWLRDQPLWQFLVVLAVAGVLAPTTEELFFRGFIFRAYLTRYGPAVAYLGSSLLFAALHLNLPAFLALAVLGALLAWLYRATGSIIVAIVAHSFNNVVGIVGIYFGNAALP